MVSRGLERYSAPAHGAGVRHPLSRQTHEGPKASAGAFLGLVWEAESRELPVLEVTGDAIAEEARFYRILK